MRFDRRTLSLTGKTFGLPMAVFALLLLPSPRSHAETVSTDVISPSSPASGQTEPVSCAQGTDLPVRQLSGRVTDPSGAAVSQAQLTLTCGGFRSVATTDTTGTYSFSVPAGQYRLQVAAPNFGTVSQNVIVADTSSATTLNPVLHVGQVRNSVVVTAGNIFETAASNAGTKMDLPLNQVPQAISIVNRDLMDSEDVVKLDDALRNVAGVMPGGYYDGWDYYRIRGFDASFNTYIDGLRGGNGMMEETWGLESVDVIKGPSSTLYGQSVLGGLVNLQTRKPIPQNFAHVQVTGGSFNFVDPAIDAGGVLNSSHSLYGRIAALYHTADTFVDYSYRHRYYFAPSITWKPAEATSLTFMGRFQRDNGRNGMPLPADGTVLPNPNGVLPISLYIGELEANANKLSQSTRQFGWQFRQGFGDHLTLRQNARFDWYTQDWNRIYYPSYLGADQRTLYRYPLTWHGPWQDQAVDTSLEGHGHALGMDHHALFGVDFFRNPTTGLGYSIDFSNPDAYEPLDIFHPIYGANPIQPLSLYTSSQTVTQYVGLYLMDHIRLPQHVTVTAGGRVDFSKNESKGSPNADATGFSPRLGITWEAVPSTTIYASFGKSFMPQSGQVFDGSLSGHSIAPERGQQWEGGVKSSLWHDRIGATMALFQLNRLNVATTDPSHPNFYLVTGQQRSRGVELEATLHPLSGWNITSAYSYINAIVTQDSTIPTGTPTINAPKNIFNVWSTYEIPRGPAHGLLFGFGGNRYSDQAGDLENSFQLPGYGLLNASASYRRGRAQWQFNAMNISNSRYFAGSYNDLYVKPGEPRTLRGTMSWNF